jgi:threonine/homoserine/homoserine lactone efflux protein
VWLQVLALGLSFATLGALSDSLYAIAAGTVADKLRGSRRIARFERWFGGCMLIGLGVAAAAIAPSRTN